MLKSEEGGRKTPIAANFKPQFYFRTTDVTGELVDLFDDENQERLEMAMPGDNITTTVHLSQGIAMAKGLRFAVREGGKTIGSGVILEVIE